MKTIVLVSQLLLPFVKNNWFKLSLALLCLYAWVKKDFSIQLQMGQPERQELRPAKPKVKYTDSDPLVVEAPGAVRKMEVPQMGGLEWVGVGQRTLSSVADQTKQSYLKRFAKVAVAEQQRYGVPASVMLALSFRQSAAGEGDLARSCNNHFSLPCSTDWTGSCQEVGANAYRKYGTAWESFRDFSLFASQHFSHLRGKKYQQWAAALKKAGFEGASDLPEIIEEYQLHELDR